MSKHFYVYYSYEEFGRGYIGSRGCKCLPEDDSKYYGSFHDKTFNPTQKIILGVYESRKDAYEAEILLHEFYDVARNPHFANRSKLKQQLNGKTQAIIAQIKLLQHLFFFAIVTEL